MSRNSACDILAAGSDPGIGMRIWMRGLFSVRGAMTTIQPSEIPGRCVRIGLDQLLGGAGGQNTRVIRVLRGPLSGELLDRRPQFF